MYAGSKQSFGCSHVPLAGTACSNHMQEPRAGPTCRTTCRNHVQEPLAGTTLQEPPAGATCKSPLQEPPAGTTCRSHLQETLARTTCRIHLQAPLAGTTSGRAAALARGASREFFSASTTLSLLSAGGGAAAWSVPRILVGIDERASLCLRRAAALALGASRKLFWELTTLSLFWLKHSHYPKPRLHRLHAPHHLLTRTYTTAPTPHRDRGTWKVATYASLASVELIATPLPMINIFLIDMLLCYQCTNPLPGSLLTRVRLLSGHQMMRSLLVPSASTRTPQHLHCPHTPQHLHRTTTAAPRTRPHSRPLLKQLEEFENLFKEPGVPSRVPGNRQSLPLIVISS